MLLDLLLLTLNQIVRDWSFVEVGQKWISGNGTALVVEHALVKFPLNLGNILRNRSRRRDFLRVGRKGKKN